MRIISKLLFLATLMATLSVCLSQNDIRCKLASQIENISDFVREPQLTLKTRSSPVVVVAGGGLAGLTAAISAAEEGAYVYLVEKSNRLGGNSAKATSGLNAVGTLPQSYYSTSDSCSLFYSDTLCAGLDMNYLELISALVHDSAESFNWLTANNVPLNNLTILGGHSSKRTHYPINSPKRHPMTAGAQLIHYLNETINNTPTISVLLNTSLNDVLIHNGRVYGANVTQKYKPRIIKADSVILTTGGYAGSRSMIQKWAPRLAKLPSTNSPNSAGEGVMIGLRAGADIIEMDKVQVHPTSFIDPTDPDNMVKFLAPEALRGAGAILVNEQGERFINELATRKTVSEAMMRQNNTYLIMDYNMANKIGQNFYFYKSRKLINYYENAREASETLDINYYGLIDTLTKANIDASAAIYVATVTPAVHYSIGGLRINADGNVLKSDMSEVVGLFAAGEVSGGIHGADRLGGNSLTECVVMGRRAGRASVLKNWSESAQLRKLALPFKLATFISDINNLVDSLPFESSGTRLKITASTHSAVSYIIRTARKLEIPFTFDTSATEGIIIDFTPKMTLNTSSYLQKKLLGSRLIPKMCEFAVFVDNKGNLLHATHDSPLFELLWSMNNKDVHLLNLECGASEILAVYPDQTCSCEVIYRDDEQAIVRNCENSPNTKPFVYNLPSFILDDEYTQRKIINAVSGLFNGN